MGQYRCNVCEKVFTASSSLHEHERIHLGIKPYKCNVCGKSFTQSVTLDTHLRTHTGEKPYKCDQCDKCFTQSAGLIRHRVAHTGIKPYRCDVCGKSFTRSTTLVEHQKRHQESSATVYECNYCQELFNVVSDLGKHQRRVHPGTKPNYQIKTAKPIESTNDVGTNKKERVQVLDTVDSHRYIRNSGIPEPTHEEEVVTAVNSIHTGVMDEDSGDSFEETYNPPLVNDTGTYYIYSDNNEVNSGNFSDSTYVTAQMPSNNAPTQKYDATGSYGPSWTIDLEDVSYPTYIAYQQALQKQSEVPQFTPQEEYINRNMGHKQYIVNIPGSNNTEEQIIVNVANDSNEQITNENLIHNQVIENITSENEIILNIPQDENAQDQVVVAMPDEEILIPETLPAAPIAYKRIPGSVDVVNSSAPVKSFHCTTCSQSFENEHFLKFHQKIHAAEVSYDCTECSSSFPKASQLLKHQNACHSKSPNYECTKCGHIFPHAGSLVAHQRTCLLFDKSNDMPETSTSNSTEAIYRPKEWKCSVCKEPHTSVGSLQAHQKEAHSSIIDEAQHLVTVDYLTDVGDTPLAMTRDERVIAGVKPYKCELCEKTFTRSHGLLIHQRIHDGVRPFKCPVCQKCFTIERTLQNHMVIHSESKPYKCQLCPKEYTQLSSLQRHRQRHKGARRQYKCDICGKGLTRPSGLDAHIQKMHFNNPPPKPKPPPKPRQPFMPKETPPQKKSQDPAPKKRKNPLLDENQVCDSAESFSHNEISFDMPNKVPRLTSNPFLD